MRCRRLEYLEVGWCNAYEISDASSRLIARRCSRLRHLSVDVCANVSDISMSALMLCPRLQELNIRNTSVTDDGIKLLAACCTYHELRYLDMGHVRAASGARLGRRWLRGTECWRNCTWGVRCGGVTEEVVTAISGRTAQSFACSRRGRKIWRMVTSRGG
eukprot:jgi/Mesvir1/14960/Mv14629-RA.1